MVVEDYCSAALRHYGDSEALSAQGRIDNAVYLGGYVIECGLKMILEVHGHGARKYGHDLRRLSGEALALAVALSPGAVRYRIDQLGSISAAAAVWDPALRYARSPVAAPLEAKAVGDGAREVFSAVVVRVILDGHGTLTP